MNKIVFLFVILFPVLCFGAYDKDKPASSTSLRASNPEILANWSALETAIGQDHEFSTGGSNTGEHLQIKFNAPISTPTNAANKLWIYSKDVSSVVEAHILDEAGNELQITSGGDLFSSTNLVVTGTSTFNGSITLGAGDDLIGSATSDITFNTNKFTVAGATGNTLVAGTLDVQGNIDPTTYETTNGGFLDEDNMVSDAADKVASQQSIKKYVDDNIPVGDNPTLNDSESNAMLKDHAYLTQTAGFVTAFTSNNGSPLQGFVGTTTDPAGAGTKVVEQTAATAIGEDCISFFVGSGKYFEIAKATVSATITWTPLISGGGAPIDQD